MTEVPERPVETGVFGRLMAPVPPGREDQIADLMARAAVFATRARADNTLAAYRSAWGLYSRWCDQLGFRPLSGEPQVVGLYLASAADRLSVASLRLHLSAIAAAHRLTGVALDLKHVDIASILGGIERSKGRRAKRVAAPILPDLLRGMVGGLPETPLGVRDRAMLLLGFGGAMRRSELVALDLADIEMRDQGVKVLFRFSKTDQFGDGQEIAVYGSPDPAICVVRALRAWLALRGDAAGPLFVGLRKDGKLRHARLCGRTVARVVKAAAERAGLDPARFSGHSLRAGLATSAALRGADLDRIMRQTRHKSTDVARRYIRDAELWRDNVSQLVFQPTPETQDKPS